MTEPRRGQLFTRYENNPILTPADWPYTVNAVFNPGAAVTDSGETVLLVRVEDRSGLSHLTVARSRDGITDWQIDHRPAIEARPTVYQESLGIEDPRITRIGDEYVIACTGLSPGGPQVCLTATRDFIDFQPPQAVTTA